MEKIITELKELIIETLALEDIGVEDIETEAPLFDDGLGLDSIDALELGVALKNKYQVSVKEENEEDIKKYFYSVQSLANFITSKRGEQV
ncbi:MAG: phosphopantetheine-binding protein [Marinicella sp.]|nr:acyl carrier protein [Xanthomonadales bacterium]